MIAGITVDKQKTLFPEWKVGKAVDFWNEELYFTYL